MIDNFNRAKVGHTGGALSERVIDLCEKLNYEIVEDKSFDILITNSMESNSGKMERARKLNLPIYTEDIFIEQYNPTAGRTSANDSVTIPKRRSLRKRYVVDDNGAAHIEPVYY